MKNKISLLALAVAFVTAFFAGEIDAATGPMAQAAQSNDIARVRALIVQHENVDAPQVDGATALHWAVYHDNREMAQALLTAGANANAVNRNGVSPLRMAALNGDSAMVTLLLTFRADPNLAAPNGETPLMYAARNGDRDTIQTLIAAGASVNARERLRGTTALMWAAEQSHAGALQTLIAAGADPAARSNNDTKGNGAYLANPVKQRLTSAFGAKGDQFGKNQAKGKTKQLPNADAVDVVAAADAAAAAAAFGRTRDTQGGALTALVYAARQNCLDCVRVLLDAGADVNQTTNYGWSPLLTATQNRNYRLAALLLDRGADPNLRNNGGWSPLYIATDNRNIEMGDYPTPRADLDHLEYIKLLLARGANPNIRVCGSRSNPAGTSDAQRCVGDSTETRTNFTMQWLFEDGATPFLRAAQSSDTDLMKVLLAAGADPKIRTAHDVTALAVASGIAWVEGVTFEWSRARNVETVKMLLDLGIDPNQQDDEGRAALHGAAHKGRNEVVQLLVDAGADLEMHDMGSRDTVNGAMLGLTWIPLHYAQGLVRVGVQSAIPHSDTAELIKSLMTKRGLMIPADITSSICLTKGVNGCQ